MHSRNLQLTVAWIMLASLIMGAALWQAQVTVTREAVRRNKDLPPPTNTRHAIRPTTAAVDPVADYIAKCEKGMTIQEIRWVLTDFENAGLSIDTFHSRSTRVDILKYRKAQLRWYLQCIIEGLNLNPAQTAQTSEKLATLFEKGKGQNLQEPVATIYQYWMDRNPLSFLFSPDLNVWDLCGLTPEQERITWKQWHDSGNGGMPYPSAGIEAPSDNQDLLSSGKKNYQRLSTPDQDTPLPSWLDAANRLLPLLASQKPNGNFSPPDPFEKFDEAKQEKLLEVISRLHPAQLKLALLEESDLEQQLREALNNQAF